MGASTSSGCRTPDPMTIRAEMDTKGTYDDDIVVLENPSVKSCVLPDPDDPTEPCGQTDCWYTRSDGRVVPTITQKWVMVEPSPASDANPPSPQDCRASEYVSVKR